MHHQQLLATLLLLSFMGFASGQTCVGTIAGGNGAGYLLVNRGGSVPATAARLNGASGIVAYNGGYVIADTNNHAIRFINATGYISTVAGMPTMSGYGGDNGPASVATLNFPRSVAAYADGFLIADTSNNAVRYVNSSGTIVTVAGRNAAAASGTGSGMSATVTLLNAPSSLAVNGTDIFIADTNAYVVRRINASGVTTIVAGSHIYGYSGDGGPATAASLGNVNGIAFWRAGILIADATYNVIRFSDFASSNIATVAGVYGNSSSMPLASGPATSVPLSYPYAVAADDAGGYYIVDQNTYVIRHVNDAGIMYTVAGTGINGLPVDGQAATSTDVNNVNTVAMGATPNSFLFSDGSAIFLVNSTGIVSTIAGDGIIGYAPTFAADGNAAATAARLHAPNSVVIDGLGGYAIADYSNHVIRRVNASGFVTCVAGQPTIAGYSGDGGAATSALLNGPMSVSVFAPAGVLGIGFLLVDSSNDAIRFVNASGFITTVAGGRGYHPSGDGGPASLAIVSNPRVVVADGAGGYFIGASTSVRWVNAAGIISTVAGASYGNAGDGGPATSALMGSVTSISVDRDSILVTDSDYNSVRRVNLTTRNISTVAGGLGSGYFLLDPALGEGPATAAQFNFPSGVASGLNGSILIADSSNCAVRRIGRDGNVTWLAGMPTACGYGGDGGPATAAQMNFPQGVSPYAHGVLIADSYNNAIRLVSSSGIINTVAGMPPHAGSLFGNGTAATSALLSGPSSVAANGSDFFIADLNNYAVRRVNDSGFMFTFAGGTSGCAAFSGAATSATLGYVYGIALHAGGLLLADAGCAVVRFVSATGWMTTVAGSINANGYGGNLNTGFSGDGGLATLAMLNSPRGVVPDGAGGFYIADLYNNVVRRVSALGTISTVAGARSAGVSIVDGLAATAASLGSISSVATDATGSLIFLDSSAAALRRVNGSGMLSTLAGGSGVGYMLINGTQTPDGIASKARLNSPQGIYADGSGGFVIADANNVLRFVNQSGYIRTVAGIFVGSPSPILHTMHHTFIPPVLISASQLYGITGDGMGGFLFTNVSSSAVMYMPPPSMCTPNISCTVLPPTLNCTFTTVAPYLQLTVTLANASCTVTQFAPAVTRRVSCPLPAAASAILQYSTPVSSGALTLQIPSPSPTPSASGSSTSLPSRSSTASGTSTASSSGTATSTLSTTSTPTSTSTSTLTASSSSSSSASSTSSSTGSATSTGTVSASVSTTSSATASSSGTTTSTLSTSVTSSGSSTMPTTQSGSASAAIALSHSPSGTQPGASAQASNASASVPFYTLMPMAVTWLPLSSNTIYDDPRSILCVIQAAVASALAMNASRIKLAVADNVQLSLPSTSTCASFISALTASSPSPDGLLRRLQRSSAADFCSLSASSTTLQPCVPTEAMSTAASSVSAGVGRLEVMLVIPPTTASNTAAAVCSALGLTESLPTLPAPLTATAPLLLALANVAGMSVHIAPATRGSNTSSLACMTDIPALNFMSDGIRVETPSAPMVTSAVASAVGLAAGSVLQSTLPASTASSSSPPIQLIVIILASVLGACLMVACAAACRGASARFTASRATWERSTTAYTRVVTGVTPTHSVLVRSASKLLVDACLHTLIAGSIDGAQNDTSALHQLEKSLSHDWTRKRRAAGADRAVFAAAGIGLRSAGDDRAPASLPQLIDASTREAMKARVAATSQLQADVVPAQIADACVDIAADAVQLHIDQRVAHGYSSSGGETHRPLRASIMLSVSHAAEVAEAAQALTGTGTVEEEVWTTLDDIEAVLTSSVSADDIGARETSSAFVASANAVISALWGDADKSSASAAADVLQLIDCMAAEMAGAPTEQNARSSVSQPHQVVRDPSSRHEVQHMQGASTGTADALLAAVASRLVSSQCTAVATLPQPVIAQLLTFAAKSAARAVMVDSDPGSSARRSTSVSRSAFRAALAAALEELHEAHIITQHESGEGVSLTATAQQGLTATSQRKRILRSSVHMASLVASMRAQATSACLESSWVATQPPPVPSFTACVAAELASWLRPARIQHSKTAFEPTASRALRTAHATVAAVTPAAVAGASEHLNPLLLTTTSTTAAGSSRRVLNTRRESRVSIVGAAASNMKLAPKGRASMATVQFAPQLSVTSRAQPMVSPRHRRSISRGSITSPPAPSPGSAAQRLKFAVSTQAVLQGGPAGLAATTPRGRSTSRATSAQRNR